MAQIAERALERLFSRIVETVGDAAIFLVAFLVVYLPARFLLVPAASWALDRSRVEETFQLSALKVIHGLAGVFAALVALTASGLASYLAATSAITAGVTIALGFAAQDVLGNFVSGVFIVLDPEFHVGDWIQWKDREGIIEDISFRVTRIHTFDNELITVPNAELTKNAVTSPTAKDRLRIRQTFGIGYGEDVDAAQDILRTVSADNEEILDRPGPTTRVVELGDSAVIVELRYWIHSPARTDFIRIRSSVAQQVTARLDAAGIEMPYPYRQLTGEIATRVADEDTHATSDAGDPTDR